MMHDSRYRRVLFTLGLVLAAGYPAWALDLGAPLFAADLDDRLTFEVQYERFDRDIRQEVAFTDDTFEGQQQEDRTRVQVSIYPAPRLALRLDVGAVASENAENVVPLAGAMARYQLLTRGATRLSVSGGGYYVEGIEYNRSGALTPVAEIAATARTESYYSLGGGLQLSHAWVVNPEWTLLPYASVAASWIRAEGSETFTLETSGRTRTDSSVDFREDSPFFLAAGLTARANRNFGARLEARFLSTASYSAGVFFSF